MTSKGIYYICLAVMAVFFVHWSLARTSMAEGGAAADKVSVRCEIRSIDAAKGEITVMAKDGEGEMKVRVPDKDLLKGKKVGDKVKLVYRPGKTNVAFRLSRIGETVLPVGCGH